MIFLMLKQKIAFCGCFLLTQISQKNFKIWIIFHFSWISNQLMNIRENSKSKLLKKKNKKRNMMTLTKIFSMLINWLTNLSTILTYYKQKIVILGKLQRSIRINFKDQIKIFIFATIESCMQSQTNVFLVPKLTKNMWISTLTPDYHFFTE